MFRKLISNLPFNPSLIGEVAFYYQRMKREEQIRRLGAVFIVLSFLVQSFAVMSPPEPTLAASDNDVIRGGFQDRDQATLHCLGDTQGFRDVLAFYGLTCDDVAKADTTYIKSTDYSKELDSMGRHSKGSVVTRTGKPTNEYPVSIGGTTFYMRNLWAFDSGAYSTYKVLKMKNTEGKIIFILYDCGNIVTIGKYTKPAPKPAPEPTPTPTPTAEPEPTPEPAPEPIDYCPNIPDIQYSYLECDACPNVPEIQSSTNECYPCPEAESPDAVRACLEFDKTASNLTQNIEDADGTTANPGDSIVYTLSVKNTGNQTVSDFVIEEEMSDVLHYASITESDGGTIQEDTKIVWPSESIKPGQTISKSIAVAVDSQIKPTPTSVSDKTAYDLVMTNVFYGNSVNISVPAPIGKTAENITTTLPKTGPAESMFFATAVTIFISYFLARTHLLRKETQIVRTHYIEGAN